MSIDLRILKFWLGRGFLSALSSSFCELKNARPIWLLTVMLAELAGRSEFALLNRCPHTT